jgi:hypothetical protein
MTPYLFLDLFCLCEEMQTSWLYSEYDIRKEYIYTGRDPSIFAVVCIGMQVVSAMQREVQNVDLFCGDIPQSMFL